MDNPIEPALGEEHPVAARHTLDDFREGDSISLDFVVRQEDVNRFAALSGDFSPLHVDDEFARRRGFSGRVVHGVLLASYVSMALGMRFPGQECLIHSLSCHFVAPTYVGDALRLTLVVDQVSPGTRTAVVKFHMDKGAPEAVVMRGKAQIGFTGV